MRKNNKPYPIDRSKKPDLMGEEAQKKAMARWTQVNRAQILWKKCRNLPKNYCKDDWYSYFQDTARRLFLYNKKGPKKDKYSLKRSTGLSKQNYLELHTLKKVCRKLNNPPVTRDILEDFISEIED